MKRKEKLIRRDTARIMATRFAFRDVIRQAETRLPRPFIRMLPKEGRSRYSPGSWKPQAKIARAARLLVPGYRRRSSSTGTPSDLA